MRIAAVIALTSVGFIGCGSEVKPAAAPADATPTTIVVPVGSTQPTTVPTTTSPPGASEAVVATDPNLTTEVTHPEQVLVWDVEGELNVSLKVPPTFIDDNRDHVLEERDRQQGLYVKEDWWVAGSDLRATFAVQRDHGSDSPVVNTRFAETVEVNGMLWGIGLEPGEVPHAHLRFAMYRTDGYFIQVSGSWDAVEAMMRGTTVGVAQ